MREKHRFLNFILPRTWFEAIKADTKNWLMECPGCGHKRDVWDEGGTRYKASGEPVTRCNCPSCGEDTWYKIRR